MAKRKERKGKVDWRLPKMVLARKNMAREMIAALEVHGDAIAEGIEARLVPLLGDREPMTDVRHFLNLLCRDLERLHGDLEGASDSHGDQLIDARRRRKDLRSAQAVAETLIKDMRRAVAGPWGPDLASEVHGISGRTARTAFELAEQGRLAVFFLSRPPEQIPPPKAEGQTVDLARWAARLKPAVERLQVALTEPPGERLTRHRKQQALAEFDDGFPRVLELAGGLYALAGLEDLFGRLRQDLGPLRRSRKPEETEVEKGEDSASQGSTLWGKIRRRLRRWLKRGEEPR